MSRIWKPGDFINTDDCQRWENGLGGVAAAVFALASYVLPIDADSTNGMRRALAAAQALNGPAVVELPPGVLTFSDSITPLVTGAQSIHVRGSGSATTTFRQTADADGIVATVGNYGPNTFLGGSFNVSGIGFEMAAGASSTRTALSISTTGVTGNTGKPLVIDDVTVQSHSGPSRWGVGVSVNGFSNIAQLSRISVIFYDGSPAVGISINGNSNSYTASLYMRDISVFSGSVGLVLGNYLQGIHIDNLNTVNTNTCIQCTPSAGVCEEIQISQSYLMGLSVFKPTGSAALGSVKITTSYFDWANTTAGATHVLFDSCPTVNLIGNTFNGSVSGVYAPNTVGLSIAGNGTPTLVQGNIFQNYGGGVGQSGTGVLLAANTYMVNLLGNAFNGCATPVTDLGPTNTWAHTTIGFAYYPFSLPFAAGVTAATAKFQNLGLSVGWNLTGGGGEVDFLLGRQNGGTGGTAFYSVGFDGKVEGGGPILTLDRLGNLSVGAVKSVGVITATSGAELGTGATANTPFLDFRSSGGAARDYDARFLASGGSTTVDGQGTLDYLAAIHRMAGAILAPTLAASASYASDAAAAAGGVAVGQLYRNGSALQIRVA